MDTKVKTQIIYSVTAVLCAAGICIGAASSADKICKTNLDIASKSASSSSGTSETFLQYETETQSVIDDQSAESQTAGAETASAADTSASSGGTTVSASESSAQPEASSASDSDSKASNTQSSDKKSDIPQTKAEIISYCNDVLNKTKAAKPGFTKKYVMDPKGPSKGVVKNVVGIVTKNETKTYKKGSDITDVFPAAEYSWSSKLREQDVTKAEIKTSGQNYDITLYLGKESNPAKGEKSSYGRVMSVIDAQGAASRLPGIKNVDMVYHDGYVHVIVDSKTGRVQKAEFSATADVSATIPIFGDVAINNICSTETFTDFVW